MRKPMFNKTPLALAVGAALSAAALTPPVLACTPDASSQTFTVNTVDDSDDSNDGVTSLREAISAANSAAGCDIVNFDLPESSTIMVNTVGNPPINATDDINIQGPGAAQLIIRHDESIGLCDGTAECGSLISSTSADVSLSDVTLSNAARSAIVSTASDLTVERVVISDNNMAFRGAGIQFLQGTNNNLVIRDSVISNNEAIDRGGAIDIPDSFASGLIENSTIESNTSQTEVGGIAIFENDVPVEVVAGMEFIPDEVNFVIRDSVIRGNSALASAEGGLAGGMYFSRNANSNNVTLSFENSQISNNDAVDSSGGVNIASRDDMAISITQTTFADNILNGMNGRLSCDGAGLRVFTSERPVNLTINDSTFSGNRVEDGCAVGRGGGIQVSVGQGGGLSPSSIITQSTFSGNAADQGGAIFLGDSLSLTITHSTITNNTAENGGGIFVNLDIEGAVTSALSNSIVAGNTATVADPDLRGLFNADFSFIGVDSANASITDTGGSVLNGGDPGLGALQDPPFSSRTQQVHVPAADSAVLDAGDASLSAGVGDTPLLDQTGRSRIVGDQIDIGSVERNNNRPPVQSPAIDAATAQVGVEFTLALNNFFSDPDGDSLTFTILNPTELPAAVMLNGSVVSGTFAAEDVGEYTVQYQACDAEGFCITGDGALTVVPAASDSSGDAGPNDNTNSGGGGGGGGSLGLGWLSLLSLLLWRRKQ